MRRLGIHKNIPVSGTELTLGLRVGFIGSHLTVDKLIPVNPRAITGPPKMSFLLEAESLPASIIKPRLILVAHTDDLGWNKTSNQQQQMFIQNLNMIVSRPNVTPGWILHCITNRIPINLMFKGNFPTNTQVRNSLTSLSKNWNEHATTNQRRMPAFCWKWTQRSVLLLLLLLLLLFIYFSPCPCVFQLFS